VRLGSPRADWGVLASRCVPRPSSPRAVSQEPSPCRGKRYASGSARRGGTGWRRRGPAGGRPPARPVLAVWLRDKAYSTTSPGAAKGRNLRLRPECSLAARAPGIDIVVKGPTSWVSDRHLAENVAAAYDDKYGWSPGPQASYGLVCMIDAGNTG
jgi:hypothetical protein